jgi:hypothetical protein
MSLAGIPKVNVEAAPLVVHFESGTRLGWMHGVERWNSLADASSSFDPSEKIQRI